MITISDKAIAPYEIDVDRYNFTVVKLTAARDKEDEIIMIDGKPKMNRKVVGYFGTLKGAISKIMQEVVLQRTLSSADMDGQIVTLNQFMSAWEASVKFVRDFYSKFEDAKLPADSVVITPKQVLAKAYPEQEEE